MPSSKHSLQRFRKLEASRSLAFFAAYYFPHYVKSRSSSFHQFLYQELVRVVNSPVGQRVAIAAPRGNAKSSITSLIFLLWCVVYQRKRFIILLSDTSSQAEEFLSDLRNEIENNERLREDFGDLKGDIWKADDIITRNQVRILVLGARKKIRGRRFNDLRPDLIVGDDLENDENTVNPEQRKKNENWWFKAVSKAGNQYTDIIIIGTIIHYDSLLANLLKNPIYQGHMFKAVSQYSTSNLWQKWEEIYLSMSETEKQGDVNPARMFFNEHQEEMLAGTKVLWPAGQSYYHLMELRLAEGPSSFESEYQNNPINPNDCLFQQDWFVFYEEPSWDDYVEFVGACDPSMGKSVRADFSAIIILGKTRSGLLDVLVGDLDRRNPDQILADILSRCKVLIEQHPNIPFTSFAIESVQFQEYFRDNVIKESRKRGFYLPVSSTDNQNSRKDLRIKTLQPLLKNGQLRFHKQQRLLLEQLQYYPLADHDDGPDALEMAVRKARRPQLASVSY